MDALYNGSVVLFCQSQLCVMLLHFLAAFTNTVVGCSPVR